MSGVNLKVGDLITPFRGDGDFREWLRKVELVAELQGIKKLETFVPLFLSDGAFAVYESLSDEVKKDFTQLKSALTTAFSPNCFAACEELFGRSCRIGESVDVYLSDIRRLAALVQSNPADCWIRCFFVRGLPEHVRRQLQCVSQLQSMDIADIVERARMMMSLDGVSVASAAAERSQTQKAKRSGVCFSCGGSGHIARHCQRKNSAARSSAACFKCGATDHLIAKCPELQQAKNE